MQRYHCPSSSLPETPPPASDTRHVAALSLNEPPEQNSSRYYNRFDWKCLFKCGASRIPNECRASSSPQNYHCIIGVSPGTLGNKERNMSSTARLIFQQHGIRGFFVGSSVRFCQYVIGAVLTVPVLEHLEKKNSEKRK